MIDQKGGVAAPPSFSSGKREAFLPAWASLRNQLHRFECAVALRPPCFVRALRYGATKLVPGLGDSGPKLNA